MTKVFVFAHNRYESMTTPLMLEADGVDHTVLVSQPWRAEKFVAGNRVVPERLHVTGLPDGLAYSRNAALDLMEEGEWALFLVDDMKQCYELDSYDEETVSHLPITYENQNLYRRKFRKPISTAQLLQRGLDAIPHLESIGCNLLGWAGFENPMFRKGKWGYNIMADGRAWLVRKTHLRFDENAQIIDDLCFTAQNIQEFGIVAVDRWILPDFRRYTAGGLGLFHERIEAKTKEAAYLVANYPDLITYKQKTGWPYGSHVALRAGLRSKFPLPENLD
jgi:hypothetical protein